MTNHHISHLLFTACSLIGQLAGRNSLNGLVKPDPYFFDKISRDLLPPVFLTFMKNWNVRRFVFLKLSQNVLNRFAFDRSQLFKLFSIMSWLRAVSLLLENPRKERKRRPRRPRYSRLAARGFASVRLRSSADFRARETARRLQDVFFVPTASFPSSIYGPSALPIRGTRFNSNVFTIGCN